VYAEDSFLTEQHHKPLSALLETFEMGSHKPASRVAQPSPSPDSARIRPVSLISAFDHHPTLGPRA